MINIVGAFFGPNSSVYITKIIPPESRKRFNSILSMTNSGAFLLGPAISGVLIMGRFGNIADMVQGIIQICFTLILGFFAEWFSLQLVCLIISIISILLAIALFIIIFLPF